MVLYNFYKDIKQKERKESMLYRNISGVSIKQKQVSPYEYQAVKDFQTKLYSKKHKGKGPQF